ncbi:MAG: putative 2-dehydropantoate 2-reductase [Bacteroidales bacterium]|nr:putative 2-dehydropantoate 2-reductase [Bacteroidales bacterium]
MRYAIIGTGAIGGYYGAKLVRAGRDVHFLLHSDYEYVRQHGLRIESCDGDFTLPHVNAYRRAADMPACDVVIVGMKNVNNHMLPDLVRPVLKPGGIVLLIQNGIGVEADMQKALPEAQLAAGLAFICSAKAGPGLIRHQCYGSINIGNYSCRDRELFDRLLEDLQDASIKAAEVDYATARWRKAVWNMPFNGMTVALDTRTDLLLKNPATRHLIREQMMEVVGAAQALGVRGLDEKFVDKMIADTLTMTPYSPSMKLDYDNGRPMEIYYLYTRPIEEARKAGFSMPRLAMLEAELRFKQETSGISPWEKHYKG